MGQPLFEFTALDDVDGLYAAARGDLRCTAIRLRTGGLCLFSPVQGLGERALTTLAELGPVEILLAPNHYHNKGLKEYAKAFPRSLVCAPDSAVPRLEKVTGLRFEGLRKLSSRLPGNMKLVAPDGLKTGEVWISARGSREQVWIVVDAFCGPKQSEKNSAGSPGLLGTFPRFGIADRTIYLKWLERQTELDHPTILIPCHGDIVRSPRLPAAIRRLVASRL
jgi:hypothetical protein